MKNIIKELKYRRYNDKRIIKKNDIIRVVNKFDKDSYSFQYDLYRICEDYYSDNENFKLFPMNISIGKFSPDTEFAIRICFNIRVYSSFYDIIVDFKKDENIYENIISFLKFLKSYDDNIKKLMFDFNINKNFCKEYNFEIKEIKEL